MSNKINGESSNRNEQIREYLLNNPDLMYKNYTETADKFKCNYEVVRHIARRLRKDSGIPKQQEEVKEFVVTTEVERRRENAIITDLKKNLNATLKEYEELSKMYDTALAVKSSNLDFDAPTITPGKKDGEACAIVQLSDCHFGKLVVPSTVNGLNEYNQEIAKMRMTKLAENTIKLIKKEQDSVHIDTLLLILGGDFIENSQLHMHSEMTTTMSPMEEVLFAREELSRYINTVTSNINFKKIVIVCVRGNHPRISKKMVASVDYRMNYEYILYNVLKQDFKDKKFEWYIPDSEIAEIEVYGRNIRVIHGHSIKYQGGIGGLTVPLNKFIMRLDATNPAYHTFLHHFHTLSYPTKHSTLNGSVVGYDPYAFSLGLGYEDPQQSFQLLDSEKGMTIKAPIFCY